MQGLPVICIVAIVNIRWAVLRIVMAIGHYNIWQSLIAISMSHIINILVSYCCDFWPQKMIAAVGRDTMIVSLQYNILCNTYHQHVCATQMRMTMNIE